MKLNELTGIKSYPYIDKYSLLMPDFIKYIENNGFKYLNKGISGIVFLGKHSVLKIFQSDKAYENYVRMIKQIPKEYKDYIPRITSVRSYPPNPEIKFVKIEKLGEVNYNNFPITFWLYFFEKYSIRNIKYKSYNDLFNDMFDNTTHKHTDVKKIVKKVPLEFINFIIWLYYNKLENDAWDLHSGNIMMRGNTPVVIDPYI